MISYNLSISRGIPEVCLELYQTSVMEAFFTAKTTQTTVCLEDEATSESPAFQFGMRFHSCVSHRIAHITNNFLDIVTNISTITF